MSMVLRQRRAGPRAQTPQPRAAAAVAAAATVSQTVTPPLMSAVYLQLAAVMVSKRY